MPTTIRLTRLGKKKRPFYRLVVLDSRSRRDGAYLANLGYYNPFVEPAEVQLRTEEIIEWLDKGAQLSETARALLRREGVLYRYSLVNQGLDAAEVEQRLAAWREGAEARAERLEKDRRRQQRQIEDAERQRREEAAKAKAAEAAGDAGGVEAGEAGGAEVAGVAGGAEAGDAATEGEAGSGDETEAAAAGAGEGDEAEKGDKE